MFIRIEYQVDAKVQDDVCLESNLLWYGLFI